MERLWTKPFIQLTFVALFLFMALYLLLPTFPLYMKQLGGSESQIGLAAGVFTLSEFFLVYAITLTLIRPVAGKLSDRIGVVVVIVPALVVTTAALLVLSFSNGFIGVIISAVLYGIGFGSAQPALQATNLLLAQRFLC
uniref:MFS transporter n=1 Tax=Paenibacillus sedimenti TaxID=2770274 RepID=UPI0035E3EBAE